MKISWEELMATERAQFEAMTERERFVYFLLLQYGSPYRWGEENPNGADCSGSITLALYAATGFLLRTTADGLFKKVFTKTIPSRSDIQAVFFVTEGERPHGGGTAKKGTAIHVAGLVDEKVVLNAQEPKARVRSLPDIATWFQREGCSVLVRGLDREALEKEALSGGSLFGVDAELARYFMAERRSA